ncbi:unnamed protein product, partial [Prorocentrum cordatum]
MADAVPDAAAASAQGCWYDRPGRATDGVVVCGRLRLRVCERPSAAVGTGGDMWPASRALLHLLCDSGRFPGEAPLAGQRVAELGAGVGLPGMACALLGAEVVLTDEESQRNATLDLRLPSLPGHARTPCGAVAPVPRPWPCLPPREPGEGLGRHPREHPGELRGGPRGPRLRRPRGVAGASAAGGRCSAAALSWGEDVSRLGPPFSHPFDWVLGADILYLPELFPALVGSLDALAGRTGRVLLAWERRSASEARFLELARERFPHVEDAFEGLGEGARAEFCNVSLVVLSRAELGPSEAAGAR